MPRHDLGRKIFKFVIKKAQREKKSYKLAAGSSFFSQNFNIENF